MICACLLLALPAASFAARAKSYLQLFITQPYLELHTGPGRGYPVTQVVGRGDSVDVLMRRTEWFKVRTERGVEGWASERDLVLARLADGTPFTFNRGTREGFRHHNWEGAILGGDYGGASEVSVLAAASLSDTLKLELDAGQFLGDVSNGYLLDVGLNHVFMPQWRFSPFVELGTGLRHLQPKATLTAPLHPTTQTAYIGFGARCYLSRRFFLRTEYRHYTVFARSDQNEVITEWKLGLAFFY